MKSNWKVRTVTGLGTAWLKLRGFLFSPAGKIMLVGLLAAVMVIQLVAQFRVGITNAPGFTSDDVAEQTILAQWGQSHPGDTMVGDDNWSLKYPLYIATNHLITDPLARAEITATILVLTMVICMVVALWGTADTVVGAKGRSSWQVVLPWAATLGLSPAVVYLAARMNARNIEIGIFLLLLWLLVKQEMALSKRPWLVGSLAAVAMGILAFDDPMFGYFAIVPLIVVFGGRLILGTTRRWRFAAAVTGVGVVALAVNRVLKWAFLHLLPVYYAVRPVQLTTFTGFINHINDFFGTSLILFGADIWGRMIAPTLSIRFLNLFVLGVSFYAALRLLFAKGGPAEGSASYLGLLPFWIIVIVALSSFNADLRYFVLLPFVLAAGLVVAAGRGLVSSRLITMVVCVFLLSGLFNTAKAVRVLAHHPASAANIEEQAVARELAARHLTKGMATYWHANITSFYTDYHTNVIGISCANGTGRAVYDPILSASNILHQSASQSFVLYYPPELTGVDECSLMAVTKTFGRPDEDIAIPGSHGARLAIYDHDATIALLSKK